MRDVVFVLVILGFFAIAAAYVGACERIVGRGRAVDVRAEPGDGRNEVEAAA